MNTMKKFFALVIGVSVLASAQGQLFTPEGLSGAAWGGFLGGMIGANNGCHTGEGIAIGASAGFLLGTAVHASRVEQASYSSYEPADAHAGYYDPNWYYDRPTYAYRPSRAFEGAFVGGLLGGIIGENNDCYGLEGAAIGMGAGFLLGGLADYIAYRRERSRQVYTYAPVQPAPVADAPVPTAPPPQTRAVTTARPASPMSGVNALFGR